MLQVVSALLFKQPITRLLSESKWREVDSFAATVFRNRTAACQTRGTEDAEALYKVMANSRVHTYTGKRPWTLKHTEEYIQFMLNKDIKTLALFQGACLTKADNQLIGLTSMNPYLPGQPELEWQFGAPFWGKGYTTEVGKAIIRETFAQTDIAAIFGMAHPENKASVKVLQKIGMTCLGLQEFRGQMDM